MNPSPIFDRAYGEIRRRLLGGEWLPGQRLDLVPLADGVGASITPVRDALYRLAGEGLLALGASEGFVVPGVTEPELSDRYDWNETLLGLAVRSLSHPISREHPNLPPDIQAARLFGLFGEQAPNGELSAAVAVMNDRLAHARHVEVAIGVATADEIGALLDLAADGDTRRLRSELHRYHRRRRRFAGRIVYAMHRPT
jgi:hypothetical protein